MRQTVINWRQYRKELPRKWQRVPVLLNNAHISVATFGRAKFNAIDHLVTHFANPEDIVNYGENGRIP